MTSGSLREISSVLGNALKPYLDRQGLFAAKFIESPINKVKDSTKEITVIRIGSGYSAIRPFLQYRKQRSCPSKVNMIISLRHRDDIGFMRNGLETL